jgi:hypothetical protein
LGAAKKAVEREVICKIMKLFLTHQLKVGDDPFSEKGV